MKKILKRAFALTLTGCLLLCAGGCTKSKKTDNEKKVTVSIMTSGRSSMEVMQQLVDKFNADNDRIQITYTVKSDNINDILKTAYSSNTAPDIHAGITGALGDAAIKSGWYRELPDSLVKESKEKFIEGSVVPSNVNGKYYYVNTGDGGASKLVWNKDMFKDCGLDPEAPPKTWDEFREYAKILTQKGQGVKYGFVMPLSEAVFSRYYIMVPGAPSGLYNADGFDPVKNRYDFGIYKNMIELMQGVIKDGSVFPSPYSVDNDTARAQFSEGNIGMIFAMYWDVGVFNDQFSAKCDWGIADYPVFENVDGGYPFSIGSGGYVMSNFSEHKEQQLEVYKWLISEEVNKELMRTGKVTSTTMKSLVANKDEWLSNKKGISEFATPTYPCFMLDQPKNKPTSSLKLEGKDCFTSIKSILLEAKDVEGELQKLSDRYNAAYDALEAETHDTAKYCNKDWSFITKGN